MLWLQKSVFRCALIKQISEAAEPECLYCIKPLSVVRYGEFSGKVLQNGNCFDN
jgi:hypothetical protein